MDSSAGRPARSVASTSREGNVQIHAETERNANRCPGAASVGASHSSNARRSSGRASSSGAGRHSSGRARRRAARSGASSRASSASTPRLDGDSHNATTRPTDSEATGPDDPGGTSSRGAWTAPTAAADAERLGPTSGSDLRTNGGTAVRSSPARSRRRWSRASDATVARAWSGATSAASDRRAGKGPGSAPQRAAGTLRCAVVPGGRTSGAVWRPEPLGAARTLAGEQSCKLATDRDKRSPDSWGTGTGSTPLKRASRVVNGVAQTRDSRTHRHGPGTWWSRRPDSPPWRRSIRVARGRARPPSARAPRW